MSGTSGTPTHCVGLNASCALISSGFHYSPQLKQKWPQLATNICGIMFVVWRRQYLELFDLACSYTWPASRADPFLAAVPDLTHLGSIKLNE
jgi:hypothetical protein